MQYTPWFFPIILVSHMITQLGIPFDASASIIDRTPIPPIVHDINGNVIQDSTVGQTIVISNNFTNTRDTEVAFILLIEVRDESGITQYIAWQSGTASPMRTKMMGVSWTPNSPGVYPIRTFPISNLTSPQVLGTVEIAQHTVFLEQGNKLYRLELYDKQYEIEYSLESGFIYQIAYDLELATITAGLEGVSSATELTLYIPKAMLDKEFTCVIETIPTSSIDGIVVFVDTVETELKAAESAELLTVKVRLDAGAEVVEVLGCAIP
jgi:hypothetical protein